MRKWIETVTGTRNKKGFLTQRKTVQERYMLTPLLDSAHLAKAHASLFERHELHPLPNQNVVNDVNIQKFPRLHDLFRHGHVLRGWNQGSPGGVIVRDDHRRAIVSDLSWLKTLSIRVCPTPGVSCGKLVIMVQAIQDWEGNNLAFPPLQN